MGSALRRSVWGQLHIGGGIGSGCWRRTEFSGRGSGNSHSCQREPHAQKLEVGKNIGYLWENKWFEVSRL